MKNFNVTQFKATAMLVVLAVIVSISFSMLTPSVADAAGNRFYVSTLKGHVSTWVNGKAASGSTVASPAKTVANSQIDTIRYARELGATKLTLVLIPSDTVSVDSVWVQYGERDSASVHETFLANAGGNNLLTPTGTVLGLIPIYTSEFTIGKSAEQIYFIVKYHSSGNSVASKLCRVTYKLLNNSF